MSYLDQLKLITDWETVPALSEDELEGLLAGAALADSSDRPPSDPDWVPTYDLNSAASRGWLLKAARVAAEVEVEGTDPAIVTSKVFDNCRAMARIYASKRKAAVSCVYREE